uniref:Uncharacterized protein n=1 Tax=Glossina pallidipes TaxID=7398 RepID=A0A1B0A2W3_GLOPL
MVRKCRVRLYATQFSVRGQKMRNDRCQGFPKVKSCSARTIRQLIGGAVIALKKFIFDWINLLPIRFYHDGFAALKQPIAFATQPTHSEEERTTKKTIFTSERILDTHHAKELKLGI